MVSSIKSISDHARRTHRGGNGGRVRGRDGKREGANEEGKEEGIKGWKKEVSE